MDIDPQLAGSPTTSSTGNGVATPTPTYQPVLPQAHPGEPIGAGQRILETAALSPHLVQIQSASPASVASHATPGLVSALLDQKRPRACESCRGLKVRCESNEHNPLATCKRCAKANRECVFTAPSRKRQKKSDGKVAELEKKIDALTASLRAQQAVVAAHAGDEDDEDDDYLDDGDTPVSSDTLRPDSSDLSPISRHAKRRRSSGSHATSVESLRRFLDPTGGKIPTTSHMRPTDPDSKKFVYLDVVDRKLLTMEMAASIFNHYVEDMVPHFPAVVFPPGTSALDIRRKKPTLFLAILAAASGTTHPDLHRALYLEISRTFAERIIVNGEKSLELVQALVLCTMWYFVPENYVELKFYMYIHLAAVMALDIGIAKKKKPMRGSLQGPVKRPTMEPARNSEQEKINEQRRGSSGPVGPRKEVHKHLPASNNPPLPPPMPGMPFPDPEAIESRRTLLACYWTCCNSSMAQRRPNLLRYTMFMGECVEVLESSPEAAPSDKVLCQWVKLQKIAEEIGIGFAFDDPNATVSIDDARVQFSLKGFARQLEEWKLKCPPEALHESLELAYNTAMTYAHEIALHRDHNVDDFLPPFTESMMREPSVRPNELLSSCHIDALSRCLSSSHRVLEIFTNMTVLATRSVPVFTFVRTNYACIILIKLYFSASHPRSELGKVIDKNSLRVDEYLSRLLETFRKTSDGGMSRQAQIFTVTIGMMRQWFNKQKNEIEKGLGAAPEPTNSFKRLGLEEINRGGNPHTNDHSSNGTGPMEGMETPGSMDDASSPGNHLYDSMRPPPRRSLSAATPLHMLSNAALESPNGTGQQYGGNTPGRDIATPQSSPQTPYIGKWEQGLYPMMSGGDPGTPITMNGEMHLGNVGEGEYDRGGHGSMRGDGGGGMDTGAVESTGEVGYVPQYLFTGNGEMFMDDTFWSMMEGPINMFDLVGKY